MKPRDGDKATSGAHLQPDAEEEWSAAAVINSLCSGSFATALSPSSSMQSTECRDLGRALCIITGASRGFGRTTAREMSRLVKPGSALVLAARSGEDLRALQAELAESEAGRAGLLFQCVVADLGLMEGLESVVRAAKEAFSEDIEHIILVNNAGKKKPVELSERLRRKSGCH